MQSIQSDKQYMTLEANSTVYMNDSHGDDSHKDEIHDMRKTEIHELINFQFTRKYHERQLPSVRKMMAAMNSQNLTLHSSGPVMHNQHSSNHLLNASQLSSINSITSKRLDSQFKKKSISKILELKKEQIQRIQHQSNAQKQNDLQKVIFNLIDEIHQSKNSRAFYSQPHFSSLINSCKNSSKAKNQQPFKPLKKTSDMSMIESNIQYISIPGSYKTLGTSRKSLLQTDGRCQSMKLTSKVQQMNKIETQRSYMQTLRQLDIKEKFQLQKKNLYRTIDPNRTEKWFNKVEGSKKRLSRLVEEKINEDEDKYNPKQPSPKKQSISPKKSNKFVSKLLEKSKQQFTSLTNEVKQLTKARQKGFLLDEKRLDLSAYRVKPKEYFRIEVGKNSISKSLSKYEEKSKDQLKHLLPQIKVNGKGK